MGEDSYFSLPSAAAAPPGMILVIKMLGSSPICGLSAPPAMLNPSPVFPYNITKTLMYICIVLNPSPVFPYNTCITKTLMYICIVLSGKKHFEID
jgi:hypothetical protein